MKKRSLRKNPAALISGALIILSGFLFPIFSTKFFGEVFSNDKTTIFNIIADLFSVQSNINTSYEFIVLGMILIYALIIIFYLLNGLGAIYNRYSRYASILSIIYLFLGLIAIFLINRTQTFSFFGYTIASMTIGTGTYFITIVGLAYLFLNRWINSIIHI